MTLKCISATNVALKSIKYCECVFVALGIQHEMTTNHTVICDLPGFTIFSLIISITKKIR